VIVHQPLGARAWREFAAAYGNYHPEDVILIHPPGAHGPGGCVETRNKTDTAHVGAVIARAAGRRERNRRHQLAARQVRKGRYGELAAVDL
jgi:hypothetical protein